VRAHDGNFFVVNFFLKIFLAKKGIGFVADIRRMNVALTRAKLALYLVGHKNSLVVNEHWKSLITDAEERSCCIQKMIKIF
jgi:superfamily I DNA and/or RNA helicase